MKVEEIRALSTEEISARLDDAREELMNLRFQQSTGELIDHNLLKNNRRLVARLKTIMRERQLAADMEGGA